MNEDHFISLINRLNLRIMILERRVCELEDALFRLQTGRRFQQ